MALIDIPTELLSSILTCLDFRDVLRCRAVCARLKSVVDENVRMKYKIELAAAGMEDGLHSTLPASERLAALRERQSAWKRISWLSQEDSPASTDSMLWELYGGVFARDQNRCTLHFWQLPSKIRRIDERKWTLDDVGVRIYDFSMDPAQDLLVIVEEIQESTLCRVHLRTMTTGKAHPMAASAVLELKPEHGLFNTYSIQMSCNHLALLLTTISEDDDGLVAEFVVWDWKAGTARLDIVGEDLYSFTFLTPGYILLLAYRRSGLNDGTTHRDTTDPCIVVLDLDMVSHGAEPVPMTALEYLCAFTYPVLDRESSVVDMLLRADPGPDWLPSPSLGVPFSVSRDNGVLVVAMQVIHGLRSISTLLSFIPFSTLLTAIKSLSPGQTRRVFSWRQWGPDGSRLQVAPPRFDAFDMPCYVCGPSFAMHVQPQARPLSLTIKLYDFNQLACRRALLSGADTAALVTNPARLTGRASNIFKREVITRCPYFRRTVEIDDMNDRVNALLLGEDALIIVAEGTDSGPYYRVLSF
ncbi:hypothetical protein OH76DRAFT_1377417 [Lentinus brumalis]|uniref:F-box domain-containing protein n=1 Tax=Lentinus brumalis TaxID=2498619 RepID=A0A371DJ80_9APHY|nr:hypothetical protein OH76DRAFT_1377417 [Polyporus brumalis]